MIIVEVRSLSYVKDHLGSKSFEYEIEESKNVYELLQALDKEYGVGRLIYDDEGNINQHTTIILRGWNAALLKEEDLILRNGDIVLIMPALGGG
ncbi:MAG: MoaD/ThiS family protein [Gudongella sp.]|nr:MoaD/ThiS family protein [Gudongella sp.]